MKKLLPACTLLMAMIIAMLTLNGCGEQYGTVRGTVTRAQDPSKPLDDPSNAGTGIAQAEIIVFALEKFEDIKGIDVFKRGAILQRTTTDATGAFSLSLFKGDYMIEAVVEHLVVDSRQIEVKGGRTIDLSFNVSTAP